MKEIQTVAYQTSDGQIITDKREACSHELLLICKQIMRDHYLDDPESLRNALSANAETLAPLLTELSK